jgi:ankyrin repeat protein
MNERYPREWLRLAPKIASVALIGLTPAWAQDPAAARSESDLLRAIRLGDPAAWRAQLATGADLAARNDAGDTALHLAARRGDADAVDFLLARHADPNAVNEAGATPLHYGSGNERIVRALLAAGAKPSTLSKDGITPLISAASRAQSAAVVRLLLDAGAEVNAARPNGRRVDPLSAAIGGGDRESIRLLVERGADVNVAGGFTALGNAAFYGDVETVRLLLDRGVDVNVKVPFAGSALNTALYAGHATVARLLIEKGASLSTPSVSGHGTPPMVWSAYTENGDPQIARLMLAKGADLNAANEEGETAYSWALKRGRDTPLVHWLQEQGARPTASGRQKTIPTRALPDKAERTAAVRARIQQSVDALQRGSSTFLDNPFVQKAKCISCHQQTLPAVAFGWARERGFRVDEVSLGQQLQAQLGMIAPKAASAWQATEPVPDAPVSLGYGLDGLSALHFPANETTDAMVHYLMAVQRTDGSWASFDRRPPMEDGPLIGTAWACRAVQTYAPAGRDRDVADSLLRARRWLTRQKPRNQNEQVFQLLGLAWAGETVDAMKPFVRQLVALQRPDGGWAQLAGLESDAWATGSALIALHKAGTAVGDRSFQRGIDYLLTTQFDDGSWWVRSRTWPFQPHFDGRFPHGKDQWISAGGTAWATMALLLTLEPTPAAATLPNAQVILAKYQPPATRERAGASLADSPAANASSVSFNRDIKPLLERSCVKCHGGEKPRGKFTMDSRDTLLKGGQSGDPAIVPGRSAESLMIAYVSDKVEDLEMPPLDRREKYPPLAAHEVALLRTWIDTGAAWDAP